jgi:SAM-dependent methyltransferase
MLATLDPWEQLWAPYDEATYAFVLGAIGPKDIVLDIGAGDLRLARRMAEIAQRVVAWEMQADLLERAQAAAPLPANLSAIHTDARVAPVPTGVTVAILLMRHCTQYALYVARLRAAGCRRLITNVRWRMGVEIVDLGPGVPFESAAAGWYTCKRCGALGLIGGNPFSEDSAALERVTDVEGCPACSAADDRL